MASDSESTSHLSPKRPHQSPQTSPTKRPNTLTHKPCDGSTTPLNSEPQSCGICLSEDGKTIRGCIDSCDHYFCFVCIMEWAKVESRCPMCKRRFSTIRRPPKCGVFPTERVVNVPVRDQVYHCFGNATLVSSNPYSEVRCAVCKSEADESLLLLCDLCDSAAHTYCVGLGATVPEGDWFCQDCTVTKAEHEKTETDRDCESQTSSSNIHKRPVAEAHVSIFDIVRESRFREVERPTTVSLLPNELSSPVVPERSCLADGMTEQGSRTGARTLKRCRNVHGRIRSLRENWNAFRSGSLRFSSSLVDSRVTENQRNSSDTILRSSSGQPHSIACSSQQLDAKKSSSFNKMPNRSPCVVDKAWKMMDVAKSVERARERTSIVHQASKHPFSKVSNLKEKTSASSNLLASSSKLIGTKNPANSGPQNNYQFHSPVEGNERHMSQMVLKQKNSIIITESILKFCESSPSAQSLSKHELPSSTNVQTSFQLDVHCRNDGKPSEKFLPGTSSGVFNKHDGSACLISPAKSVTAASNTCCAELDVSSSSKMKLSNGKATMEKSCAGKKSTSDDDAKSEIQSLVKLNLKLLSIDRTLGVDAFKEIARLATHSILAACGLERPKPGVRSFSSTVCCHTNQVQQLRMSTLMPTSCRECFYVFVKDVVNTMMFEKIGCTKMSS